jgi:biopolymer transport protein ExbB
MSNFVKETILRNSIEWSRLLMISKNNTDQRNEGRGFVPQITLLVLFFYLALAASFVYADNTVAAANNSLNSTNTFFSQFVVAGGPIVWFILLPMSVFTTYLAIYLSIAIRRKILLPPNISLKIAAVAMKTGTSRLPAQIASWPDLISNGVAQALSRSESSFADRKLIKTLAAESIQEQSLRLLRRIEWCSIIANVAPMVGLFGTVFGMIKAFNILGIAAGQPRPDQLAGAISIALITTFWGLLIAIPALVIHGLFRTRLEGIVDEASLELENLFRQITLVPAHPKPLIDQPALDTKQNLRRLVKEIKEKKTKKPQPLTTRS